MPRAEDILDDIANVEVEMTSDVDDLNATLLLEPCVVRRMVDPIGRSLRNRRNSNEGLFLGRDNDGGVMRLF